MFKFLSLLLENPSDGTGGGKDESLSQDLADMEDISQDKDEEGEEVDSSEDKEDDEEESPEDDAESDEEDSEDEDDGEEEKDEDEEESKEETLDTSGRPTVKAIKAKYPKLFKDFPELRRSFFALPRYEQVFADPEQAAEAAEKSREFDDLEGSLVGRADPSVLIKTLAENNPRALKKLLGNFANAVRADFDDGYIELARPILEDVVYMAHRHGEKTGNNNLKLAARHLANFIFSNGGDIPDVSRRDRAEPSEAEKELEKERATHANEKFVTAVKDVLPKADEALVGLLSQNLKGLTRFERRAIVKEARAQVDYKLQKDTAFQSMLTKLWDRAKSEGYSDASKERVKNAWLSRARQLAVPIRNKLRQEALDARSGERTKTEEQPERKRTFTSHGGRDVRGSRSRVLDPKKIDWSKTSDMDILNEK